MHTAVYTVTQCHSKSGVLSIETADWIELIFGTEVTLAVSYSV